MRNLLHNTALLYKLLIGVLVVLVGVIVIMIYFVVRQDTTSNLDFNAITINQDATPLNVANYAEWMCNGFDPELPEGSTYKDLKQAFQNLLDNWRTKNPPPELLAHYTNEKNRLVELVNMLDDTDKEDEIIVDNTDYGTIIAYRWRLINNRYAETRNVIVKDIPETIRKELTELGCYLY